VDGRALVTGPPLVSVIIPMFDAERHVAETVRSVGAQTHRALEIIVVDDGSTDRSAEVVERVDDDRCRVIQQPNAGPAAARNTGVAAARGDMLAFVDADDLWTPRKLELQVAALQADGELASVFGHFSTFSSDRDGEAVEDEAPCPGWSLGTMLVRREAFLDVGALSARWRVGEFLDWYGRAEDLGLRHMMLHDVVLLRRVHAASLTAGDRSAWADYPKVVREMLRRRAASEGEAP